MYPCKKCGCCCRNLRLMQLYGDLDRGDGVCRYLSGDFCSIYETRPLKCRIDECYDAFFKEHMDRETYYHLNQEGCRMLQTLEETKRQ